MFLSNPLHLRSRQGHSQIQAYGVCFLIPQGSDDLYTNIHIQILIMDLIPNIGRVHSLIVQQEIAHPPTAYDSTISFANNFNSQGCG